MTRSVTKPYSKPKRSSCLVITVYMPMCTGVKRAILNVVTGVLRHAHRRNWWVWVSCSAQYLGCAWTLKYRLLSSRQGTKLFSHITDKPQVQSAASRTVTQRCVDGPSSTGLSARQRSGPTHRQVLDSGVRIQCLSAAAAGHGMLHGLHPP